MSEIFAIPIIYIIFFIIYFVILRWPPSPQKNKSWYFAGILYIILGMLVTAELIKIDISNFINGITIISLGFFLLKESESHDKNNSSELDKKMVKLLEEIKEKI